MTLATRVIVTEPTPARFDQLTFLAARRAIGIPAEHPFTHTDVDGSTLIRSEPGGFASALYVCSLPDGPTYEGWTGHDVPVHLAIGFDTAYGYVDAYGRTCDQLHDHLVLTMGEWFYAHALDWWALNEYSGEWHHRAAPYGTAQGKVLGVELPGGAR